MSDALRGALPGCNLTPVMHRIPRLFAALGFAVAFASPSPSAQTKGGTPRTPDGHPDLQGIWDFRSATPLERPARFAGREFMTPDEVVEYERLALEREDGRPPDDARSLEEQSVHPVWWLDYGKKVVKTARTSLIVDPPDGKIPPLTAGGAGARRRAPRRGQNARTGRFVREPQPAGALHHARAAGGDAAGSLQQQPADRADARLRDAVHRDDPRRAHHADGRPSARRRALPRLDGRLARPLGRRHAGRRHDELHRQDELPRSGRRTCTWSSASRASTPTRSNTASRVEDPTTWTRPWTVAYPMVKTDGPIYEYACHEGNYGLRDILSGARWEEKHTEEAAKKKP